MPVENREGDLRLVVGFDDSPESLDALHLTDALAVQTGAEVHVVAVLPDGWAGPATDLSEENGAEEHFERLFAAVSAKLDADHTEHRVVGRSAPSGLTRIAEEVSASAVVIGSSTNGSIGRVLVGDVGATLASGLQCSLIVAPQGYEQGRPDAIKQIGVAFDDSPESQHALEHAVRLARDLGADLRLIGVVPAPSTGGRFLHAGFGQQQLTVEEMDARLSEAAAQAGDEIGYEIRTGDPAECLSDASSDFDLLVLSSRGYGPLRRVMMGGVALRVMRSATSPVLVVPRGHDPD